MTQSRNLRANDQITYAEVKKKGFGVRQYGLFKSKLYTYLFSLFLIITFSTILIVNQSMLGAQISFFLGVILFIFAKQIDRYKQVLEITEFFSAMLSSALGHGYKFCVIVRQKDNKIIYLNKGFQKIFPGTTALPLRKFDTLLKTHNAPEASKKAILNSIKNAEEKDLSIKLETGKDNKTQTVALSIVPISHPDGYSVIRGK